MAADPMTDDAPDTTAMPAFPGPAVVRFAPSPNGALHLGHALSALTCFDMARRLSGRFLLRIEDIDIGRCRPEFVDGIFRDLAWLGLAWEQPVWRQSARLAIYAEAAQRLAAQGLLYPCFASRAEIQAAARPGARDPDGAPLYPRLHRHLDAREIARRKARREPFAMRIDMGPALAAAVRITGGTPLNFTAFDAELRPSRVTADPARWGDAVIQRKDVPTSYHLAVVVDDAAQGVTHVVRGQDLTAATDLHRLLQVLLGLPAPVYHHHRLIAGATGRKLSKSLDDTSLAQLRADGLRPEDLRARIGIA